jgi:molybdate transport system ATP-binding protein
MSLELSIKKKLAEFTLDVSFSVDNISVGLLGASGCGKSMTLKCIAGIETPDSGRIVINGRTVFDSEQKINLKPRDRHCGFLFQNYALFPTMTIAENINIVLYKFSKKERKRRTLEILEHFNIIEFADRKPAELSGGQQQRAALARMMVQKPDIVMLDEPFSALDSFLKQQVEQSTMDLLAEFTGTILFVSHNRDEVYRICKNLQILSKGQICRSGPILEIFANPQNITAAKLTGCKNIALFEKINENTIFVKDWGLSLSVLQPIPINAPYIGIRAHYIRPALEGETENCFTFRTAEHRNSPFSVSEYLFSESGTVSLDREISVDSGNFLKLPEDKNGKAQKLCLPANELFFLKK